MYVVIIRIGGPILKCTPFDDGNVAQNEIFPCLNWSGYKLVITNQPLY